VAVHEHDGAIRLFSLIRAAKTSNIRIERCGRLNTAALFFPLTTDELEASLVTPQRYWRRNFTMLVRAKPVPEKPS
jgi:hypothetical protein